VSELEKLLATAGTRQMLTEFIEWLGKRAEPIYLIDYYDHEQTPVEAERLIEEFLGLDSVALDQESLELELATDYPNGRLP
jgi:hypothetical protein